LSRRSFAYSIARHAATSGRSLAATASILCAHIESACGRRSGPAGLEGPCRTAPPRRPCTPRCPGPLPAVTAARPSRPHATRSTKPAASPSASPANSGTSASASCRQSWALGLGRAAGQPVQLRKQPPRRRRVERVEVVVRSAPGRPPTSPRSPSEGARRQSPVTRAATRPGCTDLDILPQLWGSVGGRFLAIRRTRRAGRNSIPARLRDWGRSRRRQSIP
jgi:hypothetical protein